MAFFLRLKNLRNDFQGLDVNKLYREADNFDFASAFFNRLWQKLHVYNFSLLICFYGKHRVGKSLASILFAYILDGTFEENMEKRVVYNERDFLKAADTISDENIKGAGIILDEAGSKALASQRWYENASKIISEELQRIGYLNPYIGFVTQDFGFVNSTVRKLSQGVFEVDRRSNECSIIKPFWVKNDLWTKKLMRNYPIFCNSRNDVVSNVYKINKIRIGMPPHNLTQRYIKHSKKFKDESREESKQEIEIIHKNFDRKKEINIYDVVDEIVKNPDEFLSTSSRKDKQILQRETIQYHFNVSQSKSRAIKQLAERKLRNSS